MAIMGLGLKQLYTKLIDRVLRELAYLVAMILYYIIAWRPELLDQVDIQTVIQFAKATKRNHDVSDYYMKIAKMRGFNVNENRT